MILHAIYAPAIYALGMTIIHSLWQIALVYAIMQLILRVLRSASSVVKYRIAGLSMLTALAFAGVTFVIVYHSAVQKFPLPPGFTGHTAHPVISAYRVDLQPNHSGLPAYLPWLTGLYLAGILLMSLRMITGWAYLHHQTHENIFRPSPQAMENFRNLCTRSGVKKMVSLMESCKARVPEVIGHFRPLVIVPVGFFANIPFEQAEAIIAHELAHIRRNDYLFNILQSVIEVLFFYHPAVYLISARIRNERENCCDDLALACCPGNVTYAKALARMAEFRIGSRYPAVALTGRKKNLLQRIKRILKPDNMKTKISDRLLAGVIILAGFGLITLTGAAALNKISLNGTGGGKNFSLAVLRHPGTQATRADSLINVDEKSIVVSQKDEKGVSHAYEMEFRNEKLASLKVDGKNIPESRFPEYTDIVKKTLESVKSASAGVDKANEAMQHIDREKMKADMEKALERVRQIDTVKINEEIQKAFSQIDRDRLNEELQSAREKMQSINWDSLGLAMKNAFSEEDARELRDEIARAQKDIDWEKIRREMEKAGEQFNAIDFDSLRIEIQKSMNSIDWDKIGRDLDSAGIRINKDLGSIDIEGMKKSVEGIDWDKVMAEADAGLKSARLMLTDSSISRLSHIDIPSIEASIREALESVGNMNPESIGHDLDESHEKLEKAQKNLENTLRELEKGH